MTDPVYTITNISTRVTGDLRLKHLKFTVSKYVTGGIAIDPTNDLGFIEGSFVSTLGNGFSPGKGFFVYDGELLKVYTTADTEAEDGSDVGSCEMFMWGK
ncbi:MAG: hypothetical protein GXX95_00880 [Methanomassiliicoccus sp.]|nr:hypothetical protein [Methanomassiliicoccus sp.]